MDIENLGSDKVNEEAKILEGTYFDKCSIFRKEKIKNPDTGVTELKEKEIYKDIKCAISRGGQSTSGANIPVEVNSYKLFCNPSILIKTGDIIKATFWNGLESEFITSKPIYYISSVQADITEKERV